MTSALLADLARLKPLLEALPDSVNHNCCTLCECAELVVERLGRLEALPSEVTR
jgi:hypothetical protein